MDKSAVPAVAGTAELGMLTGSCAAAGSGAETVEIKKSSLQETMERMERDLADLLGSLNTLKPEVNSAVEARRSTLAGLAEASVEVQERQREKSVAKKELDEGHAERKAAEMAIWSSLKKEDPFAPARTKDFLSSFGLPAAPAGVKQVLADGFPIWISRALLPAEGCLHAVELAELHCAASGWGTSRHYSVPTTDVQVSEVPALQEWFEQVCKDFIFPLLCKQYPWVCRPMHVLDAFVVKYDADAGQRSLPIHKDQSQFSVTIQLNDPSNFTGGGTWIEALGYALLSSSGNASYQKSDNSHKSLECRGADNADLSCSRGSSCKHEDPERVESACDAEGLLGDALAIGSVLSFPGGELLHAGAELISGQRYVLVAFLYQDDE
eukprot:TRINITY_DN109489_c0_g1_i1.p1 TRINITY_DN109489_c0_g1~~TRINITY_DN109489_c0_g1_i1.p1  ORF type:complete len:403 (+),score=90.79 TRINITY_DN109489_c0_g1_i1:69-1211(+)